MNILTSLLRAVENKLHKANILQTVIWICFRRWVRGDKSMLIATLVILRLLLDPLKIKLTVSVDENCDGQLVKNPF